MTFYTYNPNEYHYSQKKECLSWTEDYFVLIDNGFSFETCRPNNFHLYVEVPMKFQQSENLPAYWDGHWCVATLSCNNSNLSALYLACVGTYRGVEEPCPQSPAIK